LRFLLETVGVAEDVNMVTLAVDRSAAGA